MRSQAVSANIERLRAALEGLKGGRNILCACKLDCCWLSPSRVVAPKYPIVGSFEVCCARAAASIEVMTAPRCGLRMSDAGETQWLSGPMVT